MSLWGGRFVEPPDPDVMEFTVSRADRRLLAHDVRGSLAHVAGLEAAGLVSVDEAGALRTGLQEILSDAAAGTFPWSQDDEDVHSAVERRLGELAGAVAGKLHTGRSRNDQIALDMRLYLREAGSVHRGAIAGVVGALADAAERAADAIVPSHTHLQQAQAVPLAHHLLAHAWPLLRDRDRFSDLEVRLDESPLGAGAGGGSSLPLDPAVPASVLGMSKVFANSMDAVASRDLVAEHVFAATMALVDLSRLAADLLLWTSSEFGWATAAEAHTTGSSALPQKRNLDAAELVRGKAAGAVGHLGGMLGILSGLPLTYNRDLQEDKEHLFAVDDDLAGALGALRKIVAGLTFHPPGPAAETSALDLAEVLVGRGVPFREAHEAVGGLMVALGERGLAEATAADLIAAHPNFEDDDIALVDPVASVRARRSPGGGSVESVGKQLTSIRAALSG